MIFFLIVENHACDHDYGSRLLKKRSLFVFFLCVYTRFLAENAVKRTKRAKNGRFLPTVGNRDCERKTPTFHGFLTIFCAFKRVFENSCLLGFPQTCHKTRVHLKMQYLEKETFFLDEIFRIFYGLVHLSMGKISGQNSEI